VAFRGPWRDRLAIRELIEAYADAVVRRDVEQWTSLWAPDATWALPDYPGLEDFRGRDAIRAGWLMGMEAYAPPTERLAGMIYVATPGAIDVDGDAAAARVWTSEIFRDPASGAELRVRGRYDDALERFDSAWRFTRRVYREVHRESRP
jgi:ketosteroid isomerase-like protein